MRVEHFSAGTAGAANTTVKFIWHRVHMAHAIEMYVDGRADAAVRRLWQRLADADLPSLATRTHRRHRPHVALVVAESLAGADLEPLRAVLMSRRPALSLYVLGTFPGTGGALFLGVQVTTELLAFHADVHEALAGQPIRHWAYYEPGNWIPHCTLAEGLDAPQAGKAFGLLAGYQPITAEVTSVGIKDTTTGAITLLTP